MILKGIDIIDLDHMDKIDSQTHQPLDTIGDTVHVSDSGRG